MAEWKESRHGLAENVKRAWVYLLDDDQTALALITEMKAGGFKLVYTPLRTRAPEVIEFQTFDAAARKSALLFAGGELIVPKKVLRTVHEPANQRPA